MTAVATPVELGSGRRSVYIDGTNAPDVTDPNWIPVLDGGALQKNEESMFSEKEVSPYNTASFSPFPQAKDGSRPQSPDKKQTQLKHSHSKSSFAPEAIPQELPAEPLLPVRSSSKRPHELISPKSEHLRGSSDGQDTATSEGETSTAPSTTASMIEEQYYTLPNMEMTKEDIQPPTAPISARSSLMSTTSRAKSPFVPTSKYNRKGVQSGISVNRPATIKSEPSSPRDSPRASTALPVSEISLPLSEPSPPPPQVPETSSRTPTPVASPKLQSSKSTASDRKFRALHSHPSAQNMQQAATPPVPSARGPSRSRSRANSGSEDIDLAILPKPPSVKHRSRKSVDSRPTTPRSIYDSQQPTPAPTTPLPQLPPEAFTANKMSSRKTSIRTINRAADSHIASASVISLPRAPDHAEMADFMSRKSTVIFRRFDDVHVKLLLCLQDEISGLEQQLFALEQDAQENSIDRPGQTMRVMRELRRVVAEYGKFP